VQKPELPQNEKLRLEALRSMKILDTPPEEQYDRLTRLAKRIFNVPIALISLVDENRLWLKSANGLEEKDSPRDISFCGHAILGEDLFVIPDTQGDERFADNPYVTEAPKIKFYAGCPIKSPQGFKLGTLCIIDQKSRQMDNDDLQALKDLAQIAEHEFVSHQMATMDELTGISNRRGFLMLSKIGLSLSRRHKIPATLVYLDLDKLKPINDVYGHAEGDKALHVFANHLKKSFRNSDVYARLGGDEFAALLTNTTKSIAEEIIERFCQSLDAYNINAKHDYEISFSYGVVEYDPKNHTSVELLLADGDFLMYESKKMKRS